MPSKRSAKPPTQCFGPLLKSVRKSQELSQAEVAKAAGCTTDHLSRIERGANCTAKVLGNISAALGVAWFPRDVRRQ